MIIPIVRNPESGDDQSDDAQSSDSSGLISLNLNDESPAAVDPDPMQILAGRSNPPDQAGLTTLGLSED